MSWVEAENTGKEPLPLDLLSSFHLGHISPFAADEAPHRLLIHRFRSSWSAEGRLQSATVEALDLEPSWSRGGVSSVRFGQVGSMPVRGWFPLVAVEDQAAEVLWGASLAWSGFWQLELYRKDDALQLAGGG